ncbi:hypothetical protein KCV03_g406, partial [Aureobasidium melanogenum]
MLGLPMNSIIEILRSELRQFSPMRLFSIERFNNIRQAAHPASLQPRFTLWSISKGHEDDFSTGQLGLLKSSLIPFLPVSLFHLYLLL